MKNHPASLGSSPMPGGYTAFTFNCGACDCVFTLHLDPVRTDALQRDTTPLGKGSAEGPTCCPLCGDEDDIRAGTGED
jgi:hypothetical protein